MITIREQGVTRRLTKGQALAKTVCARALQGDRYFSALIFKLYKEMNLVAGSAAVEPGRDPREALNEKLDAIFERLNPDVPKKEPSET